MNTRLEYLARRARAAWRDMRGLGPWARMRQLNFAPATIVDVGVAQGSYELYRAFPEAYYFLFDPTPGSQPFMRMHQRKLGTCMAFEIALGDKRGEVMLDDRTDLQGATLLADADPDHEIKGIPVCMDTFDNLMSGRRMLRPVLVKIDVQGAELMVLNGMLEHMHSIDWFVIEVSLLSTLRGGPELIDVVLYMKDHGFVVYDILDTKTRDLDNATAQADLLFVRANDPRRDDRRWGTTRS